MKAGKFLLGFTGASLYCYNHQNWLKHYLVGQPLPTRPNFSQSGPPFEFPRKIGFEQDFDTAIEAAEKALASDKKAKPVKDLNIKGEAQSSQTGILLPNGIGSIQDQEGRKYIGNFHKGSMQGFVQILVPVNGKQRIEKCLFNNGIRIYSVIYTEDGERCEGYRDRFVCKKADGTIYFEKLDRENNKVESSLFDESGFLQIQREAPLSDPTKGFGTVYYMDNKCYTGEMKENEPHGLGMVKDKYGDIVFQGEVTNGDFNKMHRKFLESTITLALVAAAIVF